MNYLYDCIWNDTPNSRAAILAAMGPFDWKSQAGIIAVDHFIIINATIVSLLLWSEIMQAVECIRRNNFQTIKLIDIVKSFKMTY